MSVSLYGSGNTVIQVVNATLSGKVSTTSTSFVSSGLAVTITPQSTTSKILIMVNLNQCYMNTGGLSERFTVYRGSTNISPAGTGTSQDLTMQYASGDIQTSPNISFLDSPSTTSATTYTVYYAVNGSATGSINNNSGASTMTVLEISGS